MDQNTMSDFRARVRNYVEENPEDDLIEPSGVNQISPEESFNILDTYRSSSIPTEITLHILPSIWYPHYYQIAINIFTRFEEESMRIGGHTIMQLYEHSGDRIAEGVLELLEGQMDDDDASFMKKYSEDIVQEAYNYKLSYAQENPNRIFFLTE